MKPTTKNRSKQYSRYKNELSVKRKVRIFTSFWGNNIDDLHIKTGKWRKGKVHCSCKMCKYEKHHNIPKPQYKHIEDYDI